MEDTLKQLNWQIAYAREHSSFYGYLPEKLSSLEALKSIPPITPQDLAVNGKQMLCCSPKQVRRMVTMQTSGTTAPPKRVAFTDGDLERTVDFFCWGMQTLCGAGDLVGIFMPGSQPDGLCDLLSRGLRQFGAVPRVYGVIQDFGEAARLCRQEKPVVLVGIPSQMRRLALTAPQPSVKRVLLSADYISPAVRKTLERVWDCEAYEHFGMTESGLGCAVETPQRQGMVCREDIFLEVEDGQILLTTLRREAMPLIRYRTGDLGQMLPNGNLGHVRGRAEQQEDGICITALDDVLYEIEAIQDYQAVQTGPGLAIFVLGDTRQAKLALRAAFPEENIPVFPASEAQMRFTGKRRIRSDCP